MPWHFPGHFPFPAYFCSGEILLFRVTCTGTSLAVRESWFYGPKVCFGGRDGERFDSTQQGLPTLPVDNVKLIPLKNMIPGLCANEAYMFLGLASTRSYRLISELLPLCRACKRNPSKHRPREVCGFPPHAGCSLAPHPAPRSQPLPPLPNLCLLNLFG